jgi:uncharacterized protein (UPF0333 family)
MKTHTRRSSIRRRRQSRGQAMVEYSFINYILVLALVVGMTVNFEVAGQKMNVIDAFLRAYQIYYDSFYFVLNLPFP